jgi:hypothetical protein
MILIEIAADIIDLKACAGLTLAGRLAARRGRASNLNQF